MSCSEIRNRLDLGHVLVQGEREPEDEARVHALSDSLCQHEVYLTRSLGRAFQSTIGWSGRVSELQVEEEEDEEEEDEGEEEQEVGPFLSRHWTEKGEAGDSLF